MTRRPRQAPKAPLRRLRAVARKHLGRDLLVQGLGREDFPEHGPEELRAALAAAWGHGYAAGFAAGRHEK